MADSSATPTATPSVAEGAALPPRNPLHRYLPISFSRSHRPSIPPTTTPSTADITSDTTPPCPPPPNVQVVVLIAMPSRLSRTQAEGGEEEDLPHLEFGAATVSLLDVERTGNVEKRRMSGESDDEAQT
jgi:hypothetical protein